VGIFYHAVFMHDYVAFVETDAWYHMRLVDATVSIFPSRIWFESVPRLSGREPVNPGPFFDWIVAGAALILGLGAPSPRLVDVVGAYTPPVIGALTVVPVYVLGRELFSRRAGLWAALIVGVLPGQILLRSSLGFTDHHCAETLLTTTALMWLVLALDRERPRRQRLRLSAAAGVTFGCYLLTWGGGSLFVVIVVASMAPRCSCSASVASPPKTLAATLTPAFGIAAADGCAMGGHATVLCYDVAALAAGLAGLVVLRAWGAATSSVRHGRLVYVAALAASLAAGPGDRLDCAWGWSDLAYQIQRISPFRPAGYVTEATPLLKSSVRYPRAALEGVHLRPVPRVTGRHLVPVPAWRAHIRAAAF
jgi:asparagine N-glycosylation enzyme membrane subunit Stt3